MCMTEIQTISVTLLGRQQQQEARIGKMRCAEPLGYLPLTGTLAANSQINISFYAASLKK